MGDYLVDPNWKWDWKRFFRGKVGNKFIAWVTTTVLVFRMLRCQTFRHDKSEMVVLVIWGIATVVFMLNDAIDAAVRNAQIKATLSASVGGGKNGD